MGFLNENTPVDWKIGIYTRTGSVINHTDFDGLNNNTFLKHPSDLKLTYSLNGVDTLEFSVLIDDPVVPHLVTKTVIVRVWRIINDTINSITRTPLDGTPDFCGIVTSVTKSGEEGKVKVICQSPLWLLQCHFHIANHRLQTDTSSFGGADYEGGNANDKDWDQSALMFRLIDMINGAFKASGGDTGIRKPTTAAYSGTGYLAGDSLYWPQTIRISTPFYVQKGAITWPLIMEDLLDRAGSPDIHLEYIYDSGTVKLAYFKTDKVRGTDRSATIAFNYRYTAGGAIPNLDDVSEQSQVVPQDYANFIWVVGDGGPNGGFVKESEDTAEMTTNGIYMSRQDVAGAKNQDAQDIADDKLAVALRGDDPIYTISVSPTAAIYYDQNYFLGDLVTLNIARGQFLVTGKKQRIYQATLSYSDNNIESVELQISNDFKRKYPT